MSLRREFLDHKRKTIESFGLVSSDISNLHIHLENLKITLASIESKSSPLNDRIAELGAAVDRCAEDISMQKSKDMVITSTVEDINNSIGEINSRLDSSRNLFANNVNSLGLKLKSLGAQNRKMSKKLTFSSNSVKKLLPRSRSQSLKIRKLNSALRKSQDQIVKIKNLLNRRLKTVKRANLELEARLKSQRRRIAQLNRKIEGEAPRKPARKAAAGSKAKKTVTKKVTHKKTVTKTVTPKKTVTTIKTPKRTIKRTVTRKKTITEKVTPKTK